VTGAMAIVYVLPASHSTNQYSANLRRNLTLAGCEVRSAADIWKFKAWRNREPQVIFLSWFEDRLLRRAERPRAIEALIWIYKLVAILLQRVSIVWIKHNYRTHGQDVPDWFANKVLQSLQWASVATVVHSQRVADENGWFYLPHPLYDISTSPPSDEFTSELGGINQRIAVLGQIRESKGLDTLLLQWPRSQPMILAGKPSNPTYQSRLVQIIQDRDLDVTTIFRDLSQAEFDSILRQCQAIYIANPNGTMVVSGVFYHAASLGTPVIMTPSAFAYEASATCQFAWVANSPADVAIEFEKGPLPQRCEIVAEANSLYGQIPFQDHLERLLSELDRSPAS
jgi:beta-1,4-mannosyltransferase